MDTSNTHTDTENQPARSIAERIATPLLVFSGSLFVLLLLSLFFIIPRFTHVRVAGETYSPRAAAVYEQKLRASLVIQEDTRRNLVIPVHDELYERLKEDKRSVVDLSDVRAMLTSAAAEAEAADALHIGRLALDEQDMVTVVGSIRGVGFRSMTVLAAFTEILAEHPRIHAFTRPSYTRESHEDGEIYSPFTITFSLTN